VYVVGVGRKKRDREEDMHHAPKQRLPGNNIVPAYTNGRRSCLVVLRTPSLGVRDRLTEIGVHVEVGCKGEAAQQTRVRGVRSGADWMMREVCDINTHDS